ncbi:MAG TPA: hypothetical protein VFR97_04170 [Capillimicrobium sp.]|nr:hypothetical protein [Capillimicrobium sp.]
MALALVVLVWASFVVALPLLAFWEAPIEHWALQLLPGVPGTTLGTVAAYWLIVEPPAVVPNARVAPVVVATALLCALWLVVVLVL